MAKTKARPGLVEIGPEGEAPPATDYLDDAPQAAPDEEAEVAPAVALPTRYRVGLVCPTPLLHGELVVEAANEAEAKRKFCEQNGISDSIHPWTIERSP